MMPSFPRLAFLDSLPSAGTNGGVGLSDPATASQRRAMLDLINRLRNTGVQRDIDLPMIAVIGNQSAGKSSLIESISGITLPRSQGTCTRCPTECKLTQADTPWTCVVKLHFITDERGSPIKPIIIPFGDPIPDKVHVEERIRRAQCAILNSNTDHEKFLEVVKVPSGGNEISFSRNYVSLEISGRELADLSFVDLPGLIASVGLAGNVNDIKLVKDLVTSYIEKPSCLILLTVACETDFENQGAHHLAKQHDPEGKRTVGVLTKPDRIPRGEEESWIRLIRNEVEPLDNNWYCVKQPSSHDISQGINWVGARSMERDFFATTKPWSSLDSHLHRFLGTSSLTERLSAILAELIARRLPEIQEELQEVILQVQSELGELPPEPSSNPVGEIHHVLNGFTREVSECLKGTPDENGLVQTIRTHSEKFKREIYSTAPNFVPWERKDTRRRTKLPAIKFLSNEETVDQTDEGDDDEPGPSPVMRRRPAKLPLEPSTKAMGEIHHNMNGFASIFLEDRKGTPDENGLVQSPRPHFANVKHEVYLTAPIPDPWEGKDTQRRAKLAARLLPDEENIDRAAGSDRVQQDTYLRTKLPGSKPPSNKKNIDRGHDKPGLPIMLHDNPIYIDEVMRRAQNGRTRELPDYYPFVVQAAYISMIVKKWQEPAIDLFDIVHSTIKERVGKMVDDHFARLGKGGLKERVLMIVCDHLDLAATRAKEKVNWLLQVERAPATLNTHYYTDYRDKFLAYYRGCRENNQDIMSNIRQLAVDQNRVETVNRALSTLKELGISATVDDLPRLLPPDPLEVALGIMASVRGYFQVAYKRFVDMVHLAIDHEMVRGMERGLDEALLDRLQVAGDGAHERCAAMLQEPAAIASKRQELLKKLERLRAARTELTRLSV